LTNTLTETEPDMCRELRYLELDDLADGLLQALATESTPAEDTLLLTHLAGVTAQLAEHAGHIYHCTTEAKQIRADEDTAQVAALIADLAAARAGGRGRTLGLITALDDDVEMAEVLDQLASQDEQTPALYADRLHYLADVLDEVGLDIDIVTAIAHAVSRRPGGDA
jgi:hypothetical protein